jgi:hypothetical protein
MRRTHDESKTQAPQGDQRYRSRLALADSLASDRPPEPPKPLVERAKSTLERSILWIGILAFLVWCSVFTPFPFLCVLGSAHNIQGLVDNFPFLARPVESVTRWNSLSLRLWVDRDRADMGQPVQIEFTVENEGEEPVIIELSEESVMDICVYSDFEGRCWSEGRQIT